MKILPSQRQNALTLVEVIIVLGSIAILAALILPALSRARGGSNVNCVSNLKQVALSWLIWIHDHESSELPFRVSVTDGGTFGSADTLRNNAWWQYAFISNELSNPQVL